MQLLKCVPDFCGTSDDAAECFTCVIALQLDKTLISITVVVFEYEPKQLFCRSLLARVKSCEAG